MVGQLTVSAAATVKLMVVLAINLGDQDDE
jgi:hypothetical protein